MDITAISSRVERIKGKIAQLDAVERQIDELLGSVPTSTANIHVSSDVDPDRVAAAVSGALKGAAAAPRAPTKRRAGPAPKKTAAKRKARPTAAAAPADPSPAREAILSALRSGPKTVDELATSVATAGGTRDATIQALRRLVGKQQVATTGTGRAKQYGLAGGPPKGAGE